MVSNSKILKSRRNIRKKNAGKKRKIKNVKKGTTPRFSIHQTEEK